MLHIDLTEDQKKILMADITARIQYKPRVRYVDSIGYEHVLLLYGYDNDYFIITNQRVEINEFQLYLRKLSDMTPDEKDDFYSLLGKIPAFTENGSIILLQDADITEIGDMMMFCRHSYMIADWMLSHHFDYRGLIDAGLAVEAPQHLYKNILNLPLIK